LTRTKNRVFKFLFALLCLLFKLMTLILVSYLYIRKWSKNYLHLHFSKPKFIMDYFIGRAMALQMICHIIHCHSSIQQNHFMCTFNIVSRGRGRPCFIDNTCATFLELLSIHTCFFATKYFLHTVQNLRYRHQAHSQITKNVSLHAALLSCKSQVRQPFFLASQL